MPVAVHGIEQKAVRNLAPAACAPLPGEGAGRHRGRLGAAARIHHGLQRAGSGQGERDKTGAMQKLVTSALESEPVPPPKAAGGQPQSTGGKEDDGEREGGRLAGSSRLFTFLKLCSGATSSSQLSSARRR